LSAQYRNIIRSVVAYAHSAPSADNSQPWHFTWDGEDLQLTYDTVRVGGKTFAATSPATFLAMGAVIENLSLISETYSLDTELNMLPSSTIVASCGLSESQLTNASNGELNESPVGKRHTNRFAYQRNAVPETVLQQLTRFGEGGARTLAFSTASQIELVAKMTSSASQVRFQSQEVHEWLASSLRFDEEEVNGGDGMDVQTLDLPPGGAQFLKFTRDWRRMSLLNRLGAYRLMARLDSAPLKAAPAIIAICAPASPLGAIEAGRLLTRAWTYLNNAGLAVQPYYVVSDQLTRLADGTIPAHLRSQIEELKHLAHNFLELGTNETLHMLLRVGYPTREVRRSLRVPIDKVFTDLTATPS
jgi:hypothetical protein